MSGVGKVTDMSNGNSQKEVDRPDSGILSACQEVLGCGAEQQGFLAGMLPNIHCVIQAARLIQNIPERFGALSSNSDKKLG